jgi:uncharacterized protein DUF1194
LIFRASDACLLAKLTGYCRLGMPSPPVAVDAAIVLAADVSRSIDDEEFALERRGYADAIQTSNSSM